MSWLFIFLGRANGKGDIPVPLTIVTLFEPTRSRCRKWRPDDNGAPGRRIPRSFNYLFYDIAGKSGSVNKSRESVTAVKVICDDDDGPMTTIPTRLARAATVSTNSVHQRKRVLDLYREWMRGVRLRPSSVILIPTFLNVILLSSPTTCPIGT